MPLEAGHSGETGFWRRAARNSVWLSADRLVRGALSLGVLVCLGRFLGPERYGLYSYALAFVAVFAAFGSLAHDGVLIRELVRAGRPPETTLGSAFLLRAVGGWAGMALAVGTAWLWPDAGAELRLVAIIAAGLIFQPFDLIDHWFQARLDCRPAALVRMGAAGLAGGTKILLALRGATLPALAWMSVVEALLVAGGLVMMYRGSRSRPGRWRADRAEAWRLLRESAPMAATWLLVALFMKLDQIMLAWYAGFRDLGVYAAAVRLIDVWNFLPLAVVPALYPAIVALRQRDEAAYGRFLRRLLQAGYLLSLGVIVLNLLAGAPLLRLLFGADYAGAAPALRILSVSTVFHYSALVRAQWLLIEHKVIYHLLAGLVGVAALAGLNLWLIPRLGIAGAALALTLGYAVAGYGTSLLFRATRPFGRIQTRVFCFRWRTP